MKDCSFAIFLGSVKFIAVLSFFSPIYSALGDSETREGSEPVNSDIQCSGPRFPQSQIKIVRGKRGYLKNWPGQVVFRFRHPDSSQSAYFCGGTLIAPGWVVTAAHCFDSVRNDPDKGYHYWHKIYSGWNGWRVQIVLGTDDLRQVSTDMIRTPSKINIHPDFVEAQRGADLALVKLSEPWRGAAMRVSLSTETDPTSGHLMSTNASGKFDGIVMVSGFGLLRSESQGGKLQDYVSASGHTFRAGSAELQEVSLPLVSTEKCKSVYDKKPCTSWNCFKKAKIGEGQFCAGYSQGDKDSCQGDSGGPVVAFDRNGCPFQIGVVSWGDDCAQPNSFGVYTRLAHNAGWLKQWVPEVETASEADVDIGGKSSRIALASQSVEALRERLPSAVGQVKLAITAGRKVKINGRYKLTVESAVSGYLVVIDVDAAGKVVQIFPNQFVADERVSFVKARQTTMIPGANYGFSAFQAGPPPGKGSLIGLVVPKDFPIKALVAAESRVEKGLVPIREEKQPANYFANLIQQVDTILKKQRATGADPSDSWGFGVLDYTIVLK